MKKEIVLPVLAAALMWGVMFSPWSAPFLNFWYSMSGAALLLWWMSGRLTPHFVKQFKVSAADIGVGIMSAALLWAIFYMGNLFSTLLFDFAAPQVGDIYRMKENQNILFIGVALALVIGPAEEVFWRGYLQRTLALRYGKYRGFVAATLIYSLIHIWSFNFMLIMAAFVCGCFWGLLYLYRRSVTTNIISHALWDVAVFLVFPIGQ